GLPALLGHILTGPYRELLFGRFSWPEFVEQAFAGEKGQFAHAILRGEAEVLAWNLSSGQHQDDLLGTQTGDRGKLNDWPIGRSADLHMDVKSKGPARGDREDVGQVRVLSREGNQSLLHIKGGKGEEDLS